MRNENSKVLTELRRFRNGWPNHEGHSRRTVVYLIQGRCSRVLIASFRRIFMKSHRLWINAGIITTLIVLGTACTVKAQTVSVVQTNADQSALLQSEFGCLQCARGSAVFHSRGRQYSVSKNGWFRRFVYRFIRLVSMDEVDAKPAEYPDAEFVHEFRSRT